MYSRNKAFPQISIIPVNIKFISKFNGILFIISLKSSLSNESNISSTFSIWNRLESYLKSLVYFAVLDLIYKDSIKYYVDLSQYMKYGINSIAKFILILEPQLLDDGSYQFLLAQLR